MNLGADDYLGKPFTHDELLEAVSARIKRNQSFDKADTLSKASANLASATKARPPIVVKGYRILRKIGSGGMSEVFLAVRESDQRELALKVLDTAINDDGALLHRDVKPDNLMMRRDGTVALIDFGIAKHADHAMGHTLHGEIVGSPLYLSPDQAAGRPVSAASHICCLGVIFHEMLTGQRPLYG